MRKTKKLSIMLTALLIFSLIAGCGSGQEDAQTAGGGTGDTVTVTFYDSDGTTVLKTEEIDTGTTAENYTPEKEGYTFSGWYATPQLTHEFDFMAAITEDTSVFAGFTQFAEDTREFAILGNGTSPILLASNWGAEIHDEHKMTKAADSNAYTITLDLYEGDEFQFAIDSSWSCQRGYGYLSEIEKDGVSYFANSGALGDASVKRSNIKVAVAGNYTFTLTTHPADDTYETDNANYTEEGKENFNINAYDTIEWVYNGEPKEAAAELTTSYYIKGAGITNWQDKYTEQTGFTEAEGIHTLSIILKEGEEFLFTSLVKAGETAAVGTEYVRFSNLDEASQALFDATDSYNMIAKADGLYTFTYDPASAVLTAEADTEQFLPDYEYYMKGSYGGTEWGTEGNADYRLVEKEAGSYVYILDEFQVEEGDEMGMQSMENGSRILFYNYSNLAAAGDGNSNGDFVPKDGDASNIVAGKTGTYSVTFDAYTGEISFQAL